jgi:hypothetical protein
MTTHICTFKLIGPVYIYGRKGKRVFVCVCVVCECVWGGCGGNKSQWSEIDGVEEKTNKKRKAEEKTLELVCAWEEREERRQERRQEPEDGRKE